MLIRCRLCGPVIGPGTRNKRRVFGGECLTLAEYVGVC